MKHVSSINANYSPDGSYQFIYAPEPNYSGQCVNNIDYDTLPKDFPMRKTFLGSTSLKQLYRGPQYYPPQSMLVPDGTMYRYDTGDFYASGKRRNYGQMMYPMHDRNPVEVREYSSTMRPLPAIQLWTNYRTLTDGAFGR